MVRFSLDHANIKSYRLMTSYIWLCIGRTFHFVERSLEWGNSPTVVNKSMPVIHYTPHYLYHPSVPKRVYYFYRALSKKPLDLSLTASQTQHTKFLVMLRNPVHRAVSSYWFKQPNEHGGTPADMHATLIKEIAQRVAYETCLTSDDGGEVAKNLSIIFTSHWRRSSIHNLENFEQYKINCLARKSSRLGNLVRTWDRNNIPNTLGRGFTVAGPGTASAKNIDFGAALNTDLMIHHINKGIYVEQLQRWFAYFPMRAFLIFSLEQFLDEPVSVFKYICAFLQIKSEDFGGNEALQLQLSKKFNEGVNPSIEPPFHSTLEVLRAFYEPYNEELFRVLGRRLWDNQ